MSDVTIYGIKNCNTMKKTFDWFDDAGIAYDFHDYKKQGIDADVVKRAIDLLGWDMVINTRGMTWRKVDDATKATMNPANALKLAEEKPSVVKRPLVTKGDEIVLGFDEDGYKTKFS